MRASTFVARILPNRPGIRLVRYPEYSLATELIVDFVYVDLLRTSIKPQAELPVEGIFCAEYVLTVIAVAGIVSHGSVRRQVLTRLPSTAEKGEQNPGATEPAASVLAHIECDTPACQNCQALFRAVDVLPANARSVPRPVWNVRGST